MSSAATASAKPLSFMEKLNPLVSVYRPSETDARDAHTGKYVVKYQAMYPAAQILLLKSSMSCMLRPSQISPAMKDAAPIIRTAIQPVVSSSSSSQPLLIHMFSNGGSSSLANLYEQYAATAGPNDNDKRLPPHVTIYDSCPGLFRIPRAVAFTSAGLSSLQQLIAMPFMYAFATVWSVSMTLSILPNSLGDWYKSHNNDVGNTAEVRRVYIYSRTDALIDAQDVEAHAAEAETKGFSVALEKYDGSAHVAHLRKDESRYWEIVRRTVEG